MANRLLSLITKIFNWARKEELIESSPAMRIERPGQETERERSLGRGDKDCVDRIRQARLSVRSGLQDGFGDRPGRGEIAGMKWAEISADGWKLPGERAKKGKGHLVPLSSLARDILDGAP